MKPTEEMVWVPVEPTEEMVEAGKAQISGDRELRRMDTEDAYRAMISARPSLPLPDRRTEDGSARCFAPSVSEEAIAALVKAAQRTAEVFRNGGHSIDGLNAALRPFTAIPDRREEVSDVGPKTALDHETLTADRHKAISDYLNRLGGYTAIFHAIADSVWMSANGKSISPMTFADRMLDAQALPPSSGDHDIHSEEKEQ